MKEFFINTIDTIQDDRFSWRFKLCNIITNDRLRQNVAYAAVHLSNCTEDSTTFIGKHNEWNIRKAQEHLKNVWKL